MALGSTLLKVALEVSDVDRGVYTSLTLRVAQHPSEERERVVLRLLARGLVHEEGLEFGRGLSTTEEPALWHRDAHERVLLWVEVGKPAAARLHKASKRADRVAVVTDRDRTLLQHTWRGETVHRPEALELLLLERDLVEQLAERLERSIDWTLTSLDGQLTVVDGETVITGAVERTTLAELLG